MLTQHMVHSLLHPSGTDQSAYMSLVPTAELTEIVECPKSMVGRVIGKGGETIKALQQYTKAMIQIDQSQDPTRVAIAGERSAVLLARCMVKDIVDGNFKGFAMLRQLTQAHNEKALGGLEYPQRGQPFYVEGYGFVPPSQLNEADEANTGLGHALNGANQPSQADTFALLHNLYGGMLNGSLGNANLVNNTLSSTLGVNGAATRTPMGRRVYPNGLAASAASAHDQAPATPLGAAQQHGLYRSAPTSPQIGNLVASNHLETMYDIKSAPTSPNTAFPNPMAALSKGAPNYGNSLSAIDLFNVQASTQSTSASYLGQLDGDRIGCSTGIVGSIPEEAPATQDYDATLRLGLDSTFGNHGLSPQPMLRQHLEAGSRSLPAGALSRANAAAFRMALTQPMSVSDAQLGYQATSAAANQLFAASSPADASAALALQGLDFGAATSRMGQELVKESPASSNNSNMSLFNNGILPADRVTTSDPEGRTLYINMKTMQTTYAYPTSA